MAMTINTNIPSINAQRNLSLSSGSLATSMQRLSSGLRVNSAKDDAAGLAISQRMGAQTNGLAVAAHNANDGISMAQTAEGALSKVGDMLQRMRELAVQSANATNSESDRKAMQAEVSQLSSEIDRVAKTSKFNGANLLDGSFAGAVFQVGANAGDNITVGGIADTKAAALGKTAEVYKKAGVAGATLENAQKQVEGINKDSSTTGATAFMKKNAAGTYDVTVMSTKIGTVGDATGGTVAIVAGDKVTTVNVGALKVDTQEDAFSALQVIDKALDDVNTSRGNLGALQTRFEKTVENIDIMSENISAARGRIVDADFASETANLSRSQILQQAGTAMVAQANQSSQNVLSLLR